MGRTSKVVLKIEREKKCLLCDFKCKNEVSMRLHLKIAHSQTPRDKHRKIPICAKCKKTKCVHGQF